MKRMEWVTGCVFAVLAGCRSAAPAEAPVQVPERALDWTLGSWVGERWDAADGSLAPMTLDVRAVLGGAGQLEELEVRPEGELYRGLHLRLREAGSGFWTSHYANAVGGRLTPFVGEIQADGNSSWSSVAAERTRESRLEWQRPGSDPGGPARWRRTQLVSEDGDTTWRVVFVDELRFVDAVRRLE